MQDAPELDSIFLKKPLVDSYFSWLPTWSGTTAFKSFKAESELLSITLSLDGNTQTELPPATLELVKIGTNGGWINTLVVRTETDSTLPVIAHGYGAGLAFFYKNYPALAGLKGFNVYSIDWLGMGNSSRPAYPPRPGTDEESITQSEDFFLDALEEWRVAKKIDKMTLVGHSLGGYLSAVYALKHPEIVEKLILVSPVGVPAHPEIIEEPQSYRYAFVKKMFSWSITPQFLGPIGEGLVTRYATRRFKEMDESEAIKLKAYIHTVSSLPGSGEYCVHRLLQIISHRVESDEGSTEPKYSVAVHARSSLFARLQHLQMPTTFLYGSEVTPNMKVPVRVGLVHTAGHHLYLDNQAAFNSALIGELNGVISDRPDVTYVVNQE